MENSVMLNAVCNEPVSLKVEMVTLILLTICMKNGQNHILMMELP